MGFIKRLLGICATSKPAGSAKSNLTVLPVELQEGKVVVRLS
jgi:hypothetical protein